MKRLLIYLVSFIFGYSIAGLVSTLNALNTYFSHILTPQLRKQPKGL